MRVVGTGLLIGGQLVAAPAFNDPCHTSRDRLSWVIASGLVLGFAAFAFTSGRAIRSGTAVTIWLVATVVAVFGVGLLDGMWWAASVCAN